MKIHHGWPLVIFILEPLTIYRHKARQWKGGRVVEGCSLENCRAGNRTVGSNPTPSAILFVCALPPAKPERTAHWSNLTLDPPRTISTNVYWRSVARLLAEPKFYNQKCEIGMGALNAMLETTSLNYSFVFCFTLGNVLAYSRCF